MDAAIKHCTAGLGIWDWASTDAGGADPDVVMACAGDVPTLGDAGGSGPAAPACAGAEGAVVNVMDLMSLQPTEVHPHGLAGEASTPSSPPISR
jgi:xylulose-5-phosphate/fructose-6-phosphate phosphoketolase